MIILNENLSSEFRLEVGLTLDLCELVDSPRSVAIVLLIDNGEWHELVNLNCNPDDYEDVNAFRDDYLITSVLKKSPNIPLGIDTHEAALQSFYLSESDCSITNDRYSSFRTSFSVEERRILYRVQSRFQAILGDLDRKALNRVTSGFGHGGGATTGVRGTGSVISDKFDNALELTEELIPFTKAVMGDLWHSHLSNHTVVLGNKFFTVDKNALTKRGACTEPTLNIFVQKGIGEQVRYCLKKNAYVDINTQYKNQFLAMKALEWDLVTIDLTRASDLMAHGTVWFLSTQEWYELFRIARSGHTRIGKGKEEKVVQLEKFSSMGNGFTFELETAIFTAVVQSIVPRCEWDKSSIYGDDIICPRQYAEPVIQALDLLGFKVNKSKSFLDGNFYESCGTDWFKSQNVRPFYCKGSADAEEIPYRVQLANKLRLYAKRVTGETGCDGRFRPLWVKLMRSAPKTWRSCRVPESLGDSGIICSFAEAKEFIHVGYYEKDLKGRHYYNTSLEGWTVQTINLQPRALRKETFGRWLVALTQAGKTEISSKGRETRRGLFGKPVTQRTFVSEWRQSLEWTY